MTMLIWILALVLIPVTLSAIRRDDYHSPAASAAISVLRSVSILLVALLALTWPLHEPGEPGDRSRAVFLLDGKGSDFDDLVSPIEKTLGLMKDAGYEPLVITYGSGESDGPGLTGHEIEYYENLEKALIRLRWEVGRDDDLFIALVARQYPETLSGGKWEGMDIKWVQPPSSPEPRIAGLSVPGRIFTRQVISGNVSVVPGSRDYVMKLILDDLPGEIPLDGPRLNAETASFDLRIEEPGQHTLRLRLLDGEGIMIDERHAVINVLPRPRVLYVSPRTADMPLVRTLRDSGFLVLHVPPFRLLERDPFPGGSGGVNDLIIVDSVPVQYLTGEAVRNLKTAVSEGGSNLLVVTGGRIDRSASGSGLETLLPVKYGNEGEDDEDQTLALVAVVDTSLSMFYKVGGPGSWGHSVTGTGGWGVKIRMAQKALLNLSRTLPETSPFGVLAVTDSPSWIFEPSPSRKPEIEEDLIGRIKAYGPGINLYSGLLEASRKLVQVQADAKHIIVFLDTADVDEYRVRETGTVWDLLKDLNEEGITVSLIGFGRRGDEHIPQLNRFTDESGGYFYLTTDITEIPGFSLQDLDLVSENLISFKQRKVQHFSRDFPGVDQFPEIRGQAMTTLKPGAVLLAWTDRGFPLYASWRFGRGTVAVFTADNGASLAREWFDDASFLDHLIVRLLEKAEDRPRVFISRKGDVSSLLLGDPADGASPPSGSVRLANDGKRDLEFSETGYGKFRAVLPETAEDPLSMDIDLPGPDARTYVSELRRRDEHAIDTPQVKEPLEKLPLPRRFDREEQRAPERELLRLLIILVVSLMAVNELTRPPRVEE